jgi:hypothetical protein
MENVGGKLRFMRDKACRLILRWTSCGSLEVLRVRSQIDTDVS